MKKKISFKISALVLISAVFFNCDERVNILDLSILLFHANNPSSDISKYDLSKDGKIDLADISIMFYYWDAKT